MGVVIDESRAELVSLIPGLSESSNHLSLAASYVVSALDVVDSAIRGSNWPNLPTLTGAIRRGRRKLESTSDCLSNVAELVGATLPRENAGTAGFVFAQDFPLLEVKDKLLTVRDHILPSALTGHVINQIHTSYLSALHNPSRTPIIAGGDMDDQWRKAADDALALAVENAKEALRCFDITKTLIDQYLGHIGVGTVISKTNFVPEIPNSPESTGIYNPKNTVPFTVGEPEAGDQQDDNTESVEDPDENKTAREIYKAEQSRRRAERSVANVDQPLENPAPWAAKEGHGHSRHGYQTTDEQQAHRIRTGIAPDGRRAPAPRASRFRSPQAEAEALGRAQAELEAALRNDEISSFTDPTTGQRTYVDPDTKEPARHSVSVPTKDSRGFGESAYVGRRMAKPRHSYERDPEGNRIPELIVAPQTTALVTFEYVSSTNEWRPVSYYPKE